MKRTLIVIGAAVSASACFAVTNTSRFHEQGPNEALVMSFRDMEQHVGQRFEFKLIDPKNVVRTHGIMMPLKVTPNEGRFTFTVPQALPGLDQEPGYRVDFWADQDNSGAYNFDLATYFDGDHSWRVGLDVNQPPGSLAAVTRVDGVCRVAFSHCPCDFTDLKYAPGTSMDKPSPPIDPKGTAVITVQGASAYQGKMVQVRVAGPPPDSHVVGLYRTKMPSNGDVATFTIPACVDIASPYDVDLYIDANDNNDGNGIGYDNPAQNLGDLGWRMHAMSGDEKAGLSVTFNIANTSAADPNAGHIDVGAP